MSTQTQYSQTDLVFRFVGGQNDGSLVPVSTSKCLLGKDENHNAKCAVYRSSKGTTIKSLSSDVLVNNNAVDVEWLKQGDRITIGGSNLEVIQIGHHSGAGEEQVVPESSQHNIAGSPHQVSRQEEQILSPLTSMSQQIDDQLALEDKPASEALPTQPSAADSSVPDALSSLVAATTQEPTQHQVVPAENIKQEMEPVDPSWAEKIEREQNREQVERQPVGQVDSGTAEDLTQTLNALMSNAAESPAAKNIESNTEPAQTNNGIPQGSLLEQFAIGEEQETEKPVEKPQAESVAEVLARMQQNGDLQAEVEEEPVSNPHAVQEFEPISEPAPTATSPAQPTPTATVESPAKPASAEPGPEAGDTVHDYMTQLFQRLRGDDAEPSSVTPAPTPQSTESNPVDIVEETEIPLPVQAVEMLTSDEFKPKTTAPERNKNLDAMRELANEQAHKAIFLSQMKRRKAITLTCLGIVAGGLGLAGYSFAIAKGLDIPFFVGSACVMVSCVAGYRCASVFLGWDLEKPDTAPFPMRNALDEAEEQQLEAAEQQLEAE